ncbi:MAG: hypothetical protein M3120_00275 [Pseudomonadota bacterium]|nr:hypothetical protein [Pseudomonadota bacterium]
MTDIIRARPSKRLPVMLTQREMRELLNHLNGTMWLVVCLLYGPACGC